MSKPKLLCFAVVVLALVWITNGWIAAILLLIGIIGFMIKDRGYWFHK